MTYAYYPGCSLERNANAYHESAMAVAQRLGVKFAEIEDWNCCGATEYIAVDLLPAYALIGRNLALAANDPRNNNQVVAPCSACFLNLSKADQYMVESPILAEKVNTALAAGGLAYTPGSLRVRHLLDIFVRDVGYEAIAKKVMRPLLDLRVAPYYGCVVVRPGFQEQFDDHEYPTSMDKLMGVLKANVVDFPMKAHCCGGHMTQISQPVAMELIRRLLKNASDYDADVIVTMCPMCQLNLDAYQESVNRHFKTDYHIPILYFTQLMGLAFGMNPEELGIGREFVSANPAIGKIRRPSADDGKPKRKREGKELPMPRMPKEQ